MRNTRALNSLGPLHSLLAGRSSHRLTAGGRVTSLLPPHRHTRRLNGHSSSSIFQGFGLMGQQILKRSFAYVIFKMYFVVFVISGLTLAIFYKFLLCISGFFCMTVYDRQSIVMIITFKANFNDFSVYYRMFGLFFCKKGIY